MIRIYGVILALITSLSGCVTSQDNDDAQALRMSLPIQIFMKTCVSGRANPIAVAYHAQEMGFSPAEEELAQKYAAGKKGSFAWQLQSDEGMFGLGVTENTLCSVFVHQGDPEKLRASMEAWLPPENSGFSYEKEFVSHAGPLSTTVYRLFRSGQLIEQWVITTSSEPNGELVAIMSYNTF